MEFVNGIPVIERCRRNLKSYDVSIMIAKERALLIYDGSCVYCRRFVQMVHWLDRHQNLNFLPYAAEDAQALLRAQFGANSGFTIYLFQGKEVFWAQSAARAVVQRLGLPRFIGWLAFVAYPILVRGVSWLTRRQQIVCMPGNGETCLSSSASGGFLPLTDKANAALASIRF